MKPVDVKLNTDINSGKEINITGPKFKIGDTVRILKYKKIFAKGYVINWYAYVFVIKVKTLRREQRLLVILKANKFLQKRQAKKSLELKK